MYHFLNGKWVTEDKLTISALDLAVLRGFGIFDFLRSYNLKPFLLSEHLDRFKNSSKIMGIKPAYSKKQIELFVNEGILKNKVDVAIKIVQTGGVSSDGFIPDGKPTFFILFTKAVPYPQELYTRGIKLSLSSVMRQIPEAKSINYMASIREVMNAQKQGARDILHTDSKGIIYESTRSNFYIIKKGVLITPQEGILLGITRKAILSLAKKLKIPVQIKKIKVSDLEKTDEAFISNSSMEIAPVVLIDKIQIGNGKVGEVTQNLIKEFRTLVYS